LQNKRVVYNLLFSAASETLHTIAADPRHLGADIGFLAVLHTWDQTLRHHPHLHCVVPGGGLSVEGEGWRSCRRGFFLPVNVLARLFRRLFLQGLECAYEKGKLSFHGSCAFLAKPTAFKRVLKSVRAREWWVYAKPPFGGPAQVLAYLGRYTHRVAISNHRLMSLKDGKVTFSWRDNRHGQLQSTMTLSAAEFLRRFLLHVLPRGFQRIRQFGLLANRCRAAQLERCRQLLNTTPQAIEALPRDYQSLYQTVNGTSLRQCPACRTGTMKFFSQLEALTNNGAPHNHYSAAVVFQALDSS